jgi:hypothetical protein
MQSIQSLNRFGTGYFTKRSYHQNEWSWPKKERASTATEKEEN